MPDPAPTYPPTPFSVLYHLAPGVDRHAIAAQPAKVGGPGVYVLTVTLEAGDYDGAAPKPGVVIDRYPSGQARTVALVATLGSGAGQYAVEGGGPGGPPSP